MKSARTSILLVVLLLVALATSVRAAPVTDEGQATALFAQVRSTLAGWGLGVDRDILLKFRTRDEVTVENNANGGLVMELNGLYRPYNPETIWIVAGLPEAETAEVMAHELTHAWQSTNSPQQDRMLKEGFARWVEYKMLRQLGDAEGADRLAGDRSPDYGDGLRFLLKLEGQSGTASVVEFARNETKIP